MKIKIGDSPWREIVQVNPPARTVNIADGSVWHISHLQNEILELDLFMTRMMEKYVPWEFGETKELALTGGKTLFDYEIEVEDGDDTRFELYYFNRFNEDESQWFQLPDDLLEGVCVEVTSVATQYFLADTLFYDYFLTETSPGEGIDDLLQRLKTMKTIWKEKRLKGN